MTRYIGWDIGGAHLKVAQLSEAGKLLAARQIPCPLWEGIDVLKKAVACALHTIIHNHHRRSDDAPPLRVCHGVTMTGEMADCFAARSEGVLCILDTLKGLLGNSFLVYADDGSMYEPDVAVRRTDAVAAANWHATASCVAQKITGGILVDAGSTTTDIIPFSDRKILAFGNDDYTRLMHRELVYTGVARTPVMAIADKVNDCGQDWYIIAEQFATMADVYRILGSLPEYADQHRTADGAAKTSAASFRRLARMFGRDYDGDDALWLRLAQLLADKQEEMIAAAYRQVYERVGFNDVDDFDKLGDKLPIVGSGVGRFLIKRAAGRVGCPYVDFATLMDIDNSDADYASAISIASLLHGHYQ